MPEGEKIENVLKDFKEIADEIPRYVYENFNEILADLDSIENGKISTYLSNFMSTINELELLSYELKNIEARKIIKENLQKI